MPASGIKHYNEMDETLNNNTLKATVVNVHTGNLVVGNDNVIHSIFDPDVKREIKEIIDSNQRKSVR